MYQATYVLLVTLHYKNVIFYTIINKLDYLLNVSSLLFYALRYEIHIHSYSVI